MKKTVMAFAMALISLTAFSGMAQNNVNCPVQDTTCPLAAKECPGPDQACPFPGKGPRECKATRIFRSMDLSEDQLTKLQNISQACRESIAESVKACKAKEQRCDSVCRENCRNAVRADKQKYLDEVKKVLGNEKYVTFLEQYYIDNSKPAPCKVKCDKAYRGKGKGAKGKAFCGKEKRMAVKEMRPRESSASKAAGQTVR